MIRIYNNEGRVNEYTETSSIKYVVEITDIKTNTNIYVACENRLYAEQWLNMHIYNPTDYTINVIKIDWGKDYYLYPDKTMAVKQLKTQ